MKQFKKVFLLGAVLMCALLLVPSVHPLDAKDGAKPERVAPGLQKQLDAAGPDELVTAIVKLRSVGPPPQANLGRAGVFNALRQNARVSQAQLKAFLNQPSVKANVGVVREFWIDNIVLVQAQEVRDREIARRTDVVQVFDNYTMSLPPRTQSEIRSRCRTRRNRGTTSPTSASSTCGAATVSTAPAFVSAASTPVWTSTTPTSRAR